MAFKAVLLCASALLVQSISVSGQCYNPRSCGCSFGPGSYSSVGAVGGISGSSVAVSNGGNFIVTSTGPISPSGIAVSSDVSLGGDLNVCGTLPFLSAVAFDTTLPTSGSGSVDYSCGCNSNVGITSFNGGYGSPSGCGCRG